MPRRDGTGPMGMGAKTGRGAGFCADLATKKNLVGFGCGFGKGNGNRRMLHATGLPRWARFGAQKETEAFAWDVGEKELLKKQANLLESQLNEVNRLLASFEEHTGE
ncbi:hypothetical protein CLNEO_24460 [Anaerotignum neopropionicum]|uniref:DUF5320 domain-containing protein n=1 Tax=Anaerotignum neopropionicum TaxID=36847 RepID=A0A136WC52_9FIRM|nr:DUF5320 domain-containing protein [Anaerotignum neopropionicum]KXL52097.1 hypothetical protein CLNEO_24460 [Anaerotignum neopropionicum]